MDKKMRVADFFCGSGGFSEGFRQKGFSIVFGLDNWKPAVDTHDLNHPEGKCIQQNILELDTPKKIDEIVPDTEIIIGSPPCVAFSGSNKAGKADKTLGIQLIESFLKIIAWKKKKGILKYWVMENVPNSKDYVKEEYTFKELGLEGEDKLTVKIRKVMNAADYGAPQRRLRFFCGDFPEPKKTHKGKEVTIADVMKALSNPLSKCSSKIKDPIYGFEIHPFKLTDHFYDSKVEKYEWESAKMCKEDHPVYGKMKFPDDTDRPSRTIMATMSASTREAIIFNAYDDEGRHIGYRLPTIREIATFMSFPITYQFEAGSEGNKYKLVGNAVCCKNSAAIAEAILNEEGIELPKEFLHLPEVEPSMDLTGRKRKIKKEGHKRPEAKFWRHVPQIKFNSMKAHITNLKSDFKKNKIIWNSEIRYGPAKGYIIKELDNESLAKFMISRERSILTQKGKFKKFQSEIHRTFKDKLPEAKNFQERFYKRQKKGMTPDNTMEKVKKILDKHYPEEKFHEVMLNNLDRFLNIKRDKIPLRLLAANYACNFVVGQIKQ